MTSGQDCIMFCPKQDSSAHCKLGGLHKQQVSSPTSSETGDTCPEHAQACEEGKKSPSQAAWRVTTAIEPSTRRKTSVAITEGALRVGDTSSCRMAILMARITDLPE